jgi:hypothetical protein
MACRVCAVSCGLITGPVQRNRSAVLQFLLEPLLVERQRLGLGHLHPECI